MTRTSGTGIRITGGRLKGRKVRTVEGPGYRPATAKVREALFSMLMARGCELEGARVLDLYAGSGSLGFEALSRGAATVLFAEAAKAAAAAIRATAKDLGIAPDAYCLAGDVRALLARGPGARPYDLVFIDPPYGKDLLAPGLAAMLRMGWLAEDGCLAAEIETEAELEPDVHEDLELLTDKSYGQTRILLWRHHPAVPPSTPGPSTP